MARLMRAHVPFPPTRGGGTQAAHTVLKVLSAPKDAHNKRLAASTGATSSRRTREARRARSLPVPTADPIPDSERSPVGAATPGLRVGRQPRETRAHGRPCKGPGSARGARGERRLQPRFKGS